MSAAPSPSDFDWSAATVNPAKWRKLPLKSLGKYIGKKAAKRRGGAEDDDCHTEAGGAMNSTELYLRQLHDDESYDDERGLVAAMQSDMAEDEMAVADNFDDVPSKSARSFLDDYEDHVEALKKPNACTKKPIGRNHTNLKQVGKAVAKFYNKRISKWREKEATAPNITDASADVTETTGSITTSTAHDSVVEEQQSAPTSPAVSDPRDDIGNDQSTTATPMQSILDPSAPLKTPVEECSIDSLTSQSIFAPSAHSRSTTYSYNFSNDSNITTKAGNIASIGDDDDNGTTVRDHLQFKVKTESFVGSPFPKEKLPERKPSKTPSENGISSRSRPRPTKKPAHRGSSRSRSRTRKSNGKELNRSKSKNRTEIDDDDLPDLPSTLKRKNSTSRSSRTLGLEAFGNKSPPGNFKRKVSLDRSVKSLQVDMRSTRGHHRSNKRSPGLLEKHLSPQRKLSLKKDKNGSHNGDRVELRRKSSVTSAATTGIMNSPRQKKRPIESHHRKRHGRSKEPPAITLERMLEKKPPTTTKEDGEKSVGSRVSRSKSSDDVKEMLAALTSKNKPLQRSSSFSSADQSSKNERSKGVEYTPSTLKKLAYRSPFNGNCDEKESSPTPFVQRSKHSIIEEGRKTTLEQSTRIYRQEVEEALHSSLGTVKSSAEQKKASNESQRHRERYRASSSKSYSPSRERQSSSHRKDNRHSSSRSRSHDKAAPGQHANRRGKINHTRSQDLWLTQTPQPAPTQFIGVDLQRVPHTDGKAREKYNLGGAVKNLQAPRLDSSNKPSRRGTRSGKPSKTKSVSTRQSSSRHRSSSPGKTQSPSGRRPHQSGSQSRDRTLSAAPNLNDLDGHLVATKPKEAHLLTTSCESTAES
jgi:hypothetical protein